MLKKTLISSVSLLILLISNSVSASAMVEMTRSKPWEFDKEDKKGMITWEAGTRFTNKNDKAVNSAFSIICIDMRSLKTASEQVAKREVKDNELTFGLLYLPLSEMLGNAAKLESLLIEIDDNSPYLMTDLDYTGNGGFSVNRKDIYHFDKIINAMYSGKNMKLTLNYKMYRNFVERIDKNINYEIGELLYSIKLSDLRRGLRYYKKNCDIF